MRKLSRLWQTLERILGLVAVPAFWREYCGRDFPLIEPYLRPTDDIGATYPCPYPTGGRLLPATSTSPSAAILTRSARMSR